MANSMNPPADAGSPPSSPITKFLGGASAIDKLARFSGFQRRKPKKITASVFLHAFVHAVVSPACSILQIAIRAGLAADTTISRQGLWKRLGAGATEFLSSCLAGVLAGVPETTSAALACLPRGIARVLVVDSTLIALHSSLATCFPGASNQSGLLQASLRIQAVLDLVTGRFINFQIGSFRDNDQKAASWSAGLVRAGDLILRDLGYFTLGSLRTITEKGAYFITRLRLDTTLFHSDGKKLDLLAELRAVTGDLLEMPVLAGAEEKLQVRLVAVRLGLQEAVERRRKAKADRDKRLKWSLRRAELLGWSITLDNLPAEVPAKRIYPIYALRWRVEVVFKSWKSHLGMCRPLAGSMGLDQARAVICAAMIGAALVAAAHALIKERAASAESGQGGVSELSLLKTTPVISMLLCGWLLPAADDPQLLWRQIEYHCRYEKRHKRENFEQALQTAFSFQTSLS